MNRWLELSIEYVNQKSYLDDLFRVYPTIPEGIREIDTIIWKKVEYFFKKRDNLHLITELLKLKKFPIKDSYIAFLRHDSGALERNPKTINRICGRLYEIGLDKIYEKCSEPKETNRQIGPMFKNWVKNKALGIEPIKINDFIQNNNDAILEATDKQMKNFAKKFLNYKEIKVLIL